MDVDHSNMNNKIKSALTNTINEISVDHKVLFNFGTALDKSMVHTFLTEDNVQTVLKSVYTDDQDDLIDLITIYHVNLGLAGITDEQILGIANANSKLFEGDKILDEKLIKALKQTSGADKSIFLAILYILRLNVKHFLKLTNKGNKQNEEK
jgi:hypothetical protein